MVDYEYCQFFHFLMCTLHFQVMELTAPPPKKTKPSADEKKRSPSAAGGTFSQSQSAARPQFQPQRRSSYAGFGMQGGSGGTQLPQRKTR